MEKIKNTGRTNATKPSTRNTPLRKDTKTSKDPYKNPEGRMRGTDENQLPSNKTTSRSNTNSTYSNKKDTEELEDEE